VGRTGHLQGAVNGLFVGLAGEVTRIEHILQDYLSFARPFDEVRIAPVGIDAVLHQVVAALEARAQKAEVTLIALGGPLQVPADGRRLKEALFNLTTRIRSLCRASTAVRHREHSNKILALRAALLRVSRARCAANLPASPGSALS
jgi:nitrogen fixation/metabolism regulation signal transduction histidine kinase